MEMINFFSIATVILVAIVTYLFLTWQPKVSVEDLEKELSDRQMKRDIAECEKRSKEIARRIEIRHIVNEVIDEKLKEMQKNKRRKNKPITNKNK